VALSDELLDEPDETVNLALNDPAHAALGDPAIANLTIIDNDEAPTVRFAATSYSVHEAGGTVTITVTLSNASAKAVTVAFATSDGTAAADSDYTAASGVLVFLPGQTSQRFTVPIDDDVLDEPDETVNLALSNPSNAALGAPNIATLTIVDDDGEPGGDNSR
jgi:hypothetical protein